MDTQPAVEKLQIPRYVHTYLPRYVPMYTAGTADRGTVFIFETCAPIALRELAVPPKSAALPLESFFFCVFRPEHRAYQWLSQATSRK